MQVEGIPKEVVGIIQGIIILFVAANFVRVLFGAIKDNAVHVFFRLNLFAVFVFEVISIIVFC